MEIIEKPTIFQRVENMLMNNRETGYSVDLHNEIYNSFCVYDCPKMAEKELAEIGIFDAIAMVKNFESVNFGQVSTDLTNAQDVAQMVIYVAGHFLMQYVIADLPNGELKEIFNNQDFVNEKQLAEFNSFAKQWIDENLGKWFKNWKGWQ